MAITMTEAAARHVQRSLEGRGKGEGIRLGVRTTGCSGLAYVLEFVDEVAGEDEVFESFGVKVIIEKFRSKRMNSETVGIANDSADGYNIPGVEYAMRVTYSGEFIHAAPWSVGSQGSANVSHGCTGMSTADAGWLYNMTKRGDVVEYTGTDRQMTLDNGYGDWNADFATWKKGSALS